MNKDTSIKVILLSFYFILQTSTDDTEIMSKLYALQKYAEEELWLEVDIQDLWSEYITNSLKDKIAFYSSIVKWFNDTFSDEDKISVIEWVITLISINRNIYKNYIKDIETLISQLWMSWYKSDWLNKIYQRYISANPTRNIFEKIFYSPLFGPVLENLKKDEIIKTKKWRIISVLYSLLLITFSILAIIINFNIFWDDEEILFGCIISIFILYFLFKFSLKFYYSTKDYIDW